MNSQFGDVILKICPAKSPIESIACTSDSKDLEELIKLRGE